MSRSSRVKDYSAKDREKNKKKRLDRIEKREAMEAMKNPEPITPDTTLLTDNPIDAKIVKAIMREDKQTPLQKRNSARLDAILAKRKKDL